jgi:hypothetical protein
MPNSNIHIGDYDLQTAGSINIQSMGQRVNIDCGGLEGALTMSGQSSAGIQSGPAVLALSNEEDEIGNAVLTVGELGSVQLGCGIPELGAMIKLEPEAILISVGAPGVGASIKMTPESITFQVAEVTFTMTPAGIVEDVAECTRELTPEGHNFQAAETEVNIGVEGEMKEMPTAEGEVEGGAMLNETMADQAYDAMLDVEAGISMIM